MTHGLRILLGLLSLSFCSACDAPYGPPVPLVTKAGVTEAEKSQDIIDCHAGYKEAARRMEYGYAAKVPICLIRKGYDVSPNDPTYGYMADPKWVARFAERTPQ